MDTTTAYATLTWASTGGDHGGRNPYGYEHVYQAELVVAAHEGRKPESWAALRTQLRNQRAVGCMGHQCGTRQEA